MNTVQQNSWLPAPRPFIKCAGGKTKLIPEIIELLPKKFGTYFEPFVGGGALFWALQPKKAVLSDRNSYLISTYRAIRDNVDRLIGQLKLYPNGEDAFYDVRERCFRNTELVASDYIYLNKTCFNGLYRVNQRGNFNVPFGRYDRPTICDEDNLRACSKALQTAHIACGDFQGAILPQKGDFIYYDPPYWPVKKSSFTAYTPHGFDIKDQIRLRNVALDQKKRGIHVVLSNSDVPEVWDLYRKGFCIKRVEMKRSINSKGTGRGKVGEVLIW